MVMLDRREDSDATDPGVAAGRHNRPPGDAAASAISGAGKGAGSEREADT